MAQNTKKPHIHYAIFDPNGKIQPFTVRKFRKDSIQAVLRDGTITWYEARTKYGWSCKQILITELKK